MNDTRGDDYAARLNRIQRARWKELLDVQAPYRWNLRRQSLGRTLDVGCGWGRNLASLDPSSVGVDHNLYLIIPCLRAGGKTGTRRYRGNTCVTKFRKRLCRHIDGLNNWLAKMGGNIRHLGGGRLYLC